MKEGIERGKKAYQKKRKVYRNGREKCETESDIAKKRIEKVREKSSYKKKNKNKSTRVCNERMEKKRSARERWDNVKEKERERQL